MAEQVAGGPIDLGEGVPTPLPKEDQGAGPTQGTEDPPGQSQANDEQITKDQVQALIDASNTKLVEEYEGRGGHIAKIRSDMQTAHNKQLLEMEDQRVDLQGQIHQANLNQLDDEHKIVYERDVYQKRAGELYEELQTAKVALDDANTVGTSVQTMIQDFGVDVKDLDLSNLGNLRDTVLEAAGEQHKATVKELNDLRSKLEKLEEHPNKGKKLPTAPKVLTEPTDVTTPKVVTLLDLRKSVAQKMGLDRLLTEAELFELAEDPGRTGVDMNVVLESIQAEIDSEGAKEEVPLA